MENDKLVKILNDLLTKNYDAENGYQEAAGKIELDTLKSYFKEQAEKRYAFGKELKTLVKKYGGTPNEGTSLTADFHRTWIAIKDAFTRGEDALYSECIRGEEAFSTEFGEILMNENIPQDVKDVIRTQKRSADEALSNLKTMQG